MCTTCQDDGETELKHLRDYKRNQLCFWKSRSFAYDPPTALALFNIVCPINVQIIVE